MKKAQLKIGSIYEAEIYPEVCCEECLEVVHYHFDCPACGDQYASTDRSSAMVQNEQFKCEECGSKFRLNGYAFEEEIVYLGES